MNTNDLISNRHGNVTGPKRTADLRDFQTSFISVVVACTILSLTSSRDNSADSIGTGAFEGNEWKVCYFQKFANREKFANLPYGGGPGAIEARQLYSYASAVVLKRSCGARTRGEGGRDQDLLRPRSLPPRRCALSADVPMPVRMFLLLPCCTRKEMRAAGLVGNSALSTRNLASQASSWDPGRPLGRWARDGALLERSYRLKRVPLNSLARASAWEGGPGRPSPVGNFCHVSSSFPWSSCLTRVVAFATQVEHNRMNTYTS